MPRKNSAALEESQEVIEGLVNSLQKGDLVLFIGAGISPIKSDELAKAIKEDSNYPKEPEALEKNKLAEVAQEYLIQTGGEKHKLLEFIQKVLRDKSVHAEPPPLIP